MIAVSRNFNVVAIDIVDPTSGFLLSMMPGNYTMMPH